MHVKSHCVLQSRGKSLAMGPLSPPNNLILWALTLLSLCASFLFCSAITMPLDVWALNLNWLKTCLYIFSWVPSNLNPVSWVTGSLFLSSENDLVPLGTRYYWSFIAFHYERTDGGFQFGLGCPVFVFWSAGKYFLVISLVSWAFLLPCITLTDLCGYLPASLVAGYCKAGLFVFQALTGR